MLAGCIQARTDLYYLYQHGFKKNKDVQINFPVTHEACQLPQYLPVSNKVKGHQLYGRKKTVALTVRWMAHLCFPLTC